jgi:DNA repair protein RecO (recombination protein O)
VAPVSTRAIVLRSHDYGDSSRILRLYTHDFGLLSVMARGVRGRSGKGTTTVASFATGDLIAYVRPHRDLHTMKEFECTALRSHLGSHVLRFAGASAFAELVLAHAEEEPQTGLFDALERVLDALDGAEVPALAGTVLAGLWVITEAFGFAPQLDPCVRCDTNIEKDEVGRFDFPAGGVRCSRCGEDAAGPRVGPIARGQLGRLLTGDVPEGLTHARQHLDLVSDFIAYHVVARPLKSLRFLGGVLPAEVEAEESDG